MVTRQDIIIKAETFLDIPFVHQGRNRNGIDCAGLIELTADELGILPDNYISVRDYAREPDETMRLYLDKNLKRKSINQRLPGSILFFGYTKNRRGQHLAILTKNNLFVHGYSKQKCVCIGRLDDRWRKRLVGVYDYKGIV